MFKFTSLVLLFVVLLISDYTSAQVPPCPCDTATLRNGLSGNEIVEIICPNGNLGEDSDSVIEPSILGIFTDIPPRPDYFVGVGFEDIKSCVINADGVSELRLEISDIQFNNCRRRLVEACNLNVRPIPTISNWSLIILGGILLIAGIYKVRNRRANI